MKLNWGHKITIFMVAFMLYIVFLVYKTHQVDMDLVSDDYYLQELQYQTTLEEKNRGKSYYADIKINVDDQRVVVQLPENFEGKNADFYFYRPSDTELDIRHRVNGAVDRSMAFDRKQFQSGYYVLKLGWEQAGQKHLIEKNIQMP